MNPTIWGPSAWRFMHYITLSYPDNPSDDDKHNIKQFFIYAGKVLPCAKCRNNFKDHLHKYPLDDNVLSSRLTLVNWLIDIHNEVNIATGKPVVQHKLVIENFTNSNQDNNKKTVLLITIILIIIIIPFIIMTIWK